jgi:hypothetical protein
MVKYLFRGVGGLLINGNFFDIDEEKDVAQGLFDLLTSTKKLPEIIFYLKVSE